MSQDKAAKTMPTLQRGVHLAISSRLRRRRSPFLPSGCVSFCKFLILVVPTMGFAVFTFAMSLHNGRVIRYKREVDRLTKLAERDGLCRTQGMPNVTFNDTLVRVCQKLNQTAQSYYRLQPERVNRFPHEFLIVSPHLCNESTEVVVMIHSLHDYVERRVAVRQTWGEAARKKHWPTGQKITANIQIAFVLGIHPDERWNHALTKEQELYGDIVQGDFLEDYHNMTLKSQLALKWASEHCSSAKYLIKSDDDMIINVPELLKVMESTSMERAIMGPLNQQSLVSRRGKWALSKKAFPFYYFPPYESGSAYVISGDIIKELLDASERVPPIFIDDVYVTGILGRILRVRHIQQEGFAYWTNKQPMPCDILQNKILTGTKLSSVTLLSLWKDIVNGVDCSEEV